MVLVNVYWFTNKIIKNLLLVIISVIIFVLILLTAILTIPLKTTASEEFSVVLNNKTDDVIITLSLEYNTENNTYYITDSVRSPFLLSILNLIPSSNLKRVNYDMWTTDTTIYFLGINKDQEKYFVTSNEENRYIVFDKSTKLDNDIKINDNISYQVVIIHLFLASCFFGYWIILKKHYLTRQLSLYIAKTITWLLSGINIIYAIGYFCLITFIRLFF